MPAELNELGQALMKFQSLVDPVKADAVNPYFNSKYASLECIWDTIRKPLAECGLSIAQPTKPTDGSTVCVQTVLIHASGQHISGELVLRPAKADPQGLCGAITYARRYGLASMLGLVIDVDDDGNAISRQEGKVYENNGEEFL